MHEIRKVKVAAAGDVIAVKFEDKECLAEFMCSSLVTHQVLIRMRTGKTFFIDLEAYDSPLRVLYAAIESGAEQILQHMYGQKFQQVLEARMGEMYSEDFEFVMTSMADKEELPETAVIEKSSIFANLDYELVI